MTADTDTQLKSSCDRCGGCCREGGPALHSQDLDLVLKGGLRLEDLITVRRGELALQPQARSAQPVTEEFVKLNGQGSDWCCRFYDHAQAACTIYGHRPVACGLLDCIHPGELLAIAGRDLLSRFDLVADDDPLLSLIELHEEQCPCPQLADVLGDLAVNNKEMLEQLSRLVNRDLAVRNKAAGEFGLCVDRELFYFGRPLFQLLQQLGITVTETLQGLNLEYRPEQA